MLAAINSCSGSVVGKTRKERANITIYTNVIEVDLLNVTFILASGIFFHLY